MRPYAGSKPLLTNLSLAMRTDPLALIMGVSEFVSTIISPAVTLPFPDARVDGNRRSVLHVNFISTVDWSILNWCERNMLHELMSEPLLSAKIAVPALTAVNFNDHFRYRKLWNLRPYDRTNKEINRIPLLIVPYQKMRKVTEDWGDNKKLTEKIPEFPLIRRMLIGADSVVHTLRLRVFETNGRRMAKFSESIRAVDEEKEEQRIHSETWKIPGRMGQVGPGAKYQERQGRLARSRTDSNEYETKIGNKWEAAN